MTITRAALSPTEVADIEAVLVMSGLVALLAVLLASVHRPIRRRVLEASAGTGTVLAAAVALLATAGSLWFSEGAGFPPCDLCWYQRIAMYPLVAVLGIAAVRSSTTGRITGLVIAASGFTVSAWHVVVEAFPDGAGGGCDPANPCTIRWVEGLGFWTIPRLAAACFVLIFSLTLIDHLASRTQEDPTP